MYVCVCVWWCAVVWGAVCVCVQHVRCADRLCLGVLVYVCGGGPVCLCMHGVWEDWCIISNQYYYC